MLNDSGLLPTPAGRIEAAASFAIETIGDDAEAADSITVAQQQPNVAATARPDARSGPPRFVYRLGVACLLAKQLRAS